MPFLGDVRVRQAAEEQNAGNDQKRYELENELTAQLSEVPGLPEGKPGRALHLENL